MKLSALAAASVFCLAAALFAEPALSSRALPERAPALAAGEPDTEMRGLWVSRWSLSTPQSIRNLVAHAKQNNFNTLFVQVRGRGDAWYLSDLEPRAEALSYQPAGYDPLKTVLEEAHRQGLKVHAWLNTFILWTGEKRPKSPKHILNAHPDWIARDRNGKFTTLPSEQVEGAFLSPSHPEVQDHLTKVFTDVARRYDVDGIHFDFVRYSCAEYDFSEGALARFKAHMEPRMGDAGRAAVRKDGTRLAYPRTFPKEWADWRRAQVTGVVKRISGEIEKMKPWMQVSAAVFANAPDALKERGQDWPTWIRAGYLDAVCPMAYSPSTETVAKQIRYAVSQAGERHVYAGIGSWRLSAQDTAQKIASVRGTGARGVVLFSYDGVTKDGKNLSYLNTLKQTRFASRAGTPAMRWRAPRRDMTERENSDRREEERD